MGALTFCSGNTPRDGNTPDRLGRCRSAADERVVLACCDVGLVGSDGIGAGGSRPIAPRRERKEPPRQRPPQSATEGGAFVIALRLPVVGGPGEDPASGCRSGAMPFVVTTMVRSAGRDGRSRHGAVPGADLRGRGQLGRRW